MRQPLLILIWISITGLLPLQGYAMDTDSLLNILDKTVAQRDVYANILEKKLEQYKAEMQAAPDLTQQFHTVHQIFEDYKSYQLDSALSYTHKRIGIAEKLDNPFYYSIAQLNLAEALMITGMYKEAFQILETETSLPHNSDNRPYLYHLFHSLYMLMADYTLSVQEQEAYKKLEYQYKDSILSVSSPGDIGYLLITGHRLSEAGDYEKAIHYIEEAYENSRDNFHNIALCTNTLSGIYGNMGNYEKQKQYLILSATADLKAGVKEYISLRQLAEILYNEGDIDRAYDYIKCCMEDAIFCNARYRTLEISRMLPLINDTYDIKIKNEKQKLLFFLFIISVLSIILILAILYIVYQLKALVRARRSLKQINADLQQMNNHLNTLNQELTESDIVKEEYIGYIFNLCSAYIDKLEEFRKKVNRKLKAGQVKEVVRETNSSSLVSDQLKELYHNFDLIFLNLYPDFIEEFNTLLREEEQIFPKEGELLSPELRIYALVRLGINDSIKIAAFLHYSPQTVYNYRLKVRNKARVHKENFPDAVRQIGRLRPAE